MDLDSDLENKDREGLIEEVKKLRAGIRDHRDSSGHDLCWHHPQLWGLLPEKVDPQIAVPEWPQFLRGCVRYRQLLDEQAPDAPRITREYDPERPQPHARLTIRCPTSRFLCEAAVHGDVAVLDPTSIRR
jgi:hypothetical protein